MVNQDKVIKAIKMLLEGIGEDPNRDGLAETPERIARMYGEMLSGMDEDPSQHLNKFFIVDGNDIVIVKDIEFHSMCEHHLMPFFGKAHLAYVPDGRVVGLSKLARTVETFAHRLQIQERMTSQIADALMEGIGAKGAMAVLEAEHTCMTVRGVKKPGSKTVTMAARGVFESDEKLRGAFLSAIGGSL